MNTEVRAFLTEFIRRVVLEISFQIGNWIAQLSNTFTFLKTLIQEVVRGFNNVITQN